MSHQTKKAWLIVVAVVFFAGGLFLIHGEEKAFLAGLSEAERARFSEFRLQMNNLQPGDLVKIADEKGENTSLYMVENGRGMDYLLLREGPPKHGGLVNWRIDRRGMRESFKRVKDICKKVSGGWQELATFFYLQ